MLKLVIYVLILCYIQYNILCVHRGGHHSKRHDIWTPGANTYGFSCPSANWNKFNNVCKKKNKNKGKIFINRSYERNVSINVGFQGPDTIYTEYQEKKTYLLRFK